MFIFSTFSNDLLIHKKRNASGLSIFLLVLFAYYSCGKPDIESYVVLQDVFSTSRSTSISIVDSTLVAHYSKAGDIHNEGLDSLYEFLMTKALSPDYDSIFLDDIYDGINKFLKKKNILEVADSLAHYNYPTEREGYIAIVHHNPDSVIATKEVLAKVMPHYSPSSTFLSALDQFDSLTTIINNSYSVQYSLFDSLLYRNLYIIQDSIEKISFITTIYVTKASIQYWNDVNNISKWAALKNLIISNGFRSSLINSRDNKVPGPAKADIEGACTGAVSGAISGAIYGTCAWPGIGTVTGAAANGIVGMVYGCISGSVTAALWDLVWG